MSLPCIVISRHEAGLYEWAVCYADEPVDGDIGDTSIAGCLSSAVTAISDTDGLLEIKYRGFHMGTFHRTRIAEDSDGVAEQIANAYGGYMEMLR